MYIHQMQVSETPDNNYVKYVQEHKRNGTLPENLDEMLVIVCHDSWCAIWKSNPRGTFPCNCNPHFKTVRLHEQPLSEDNKIVAACDSPATYKAIMHELGCSKSTAVRKLNDLVLSGHLKVVQKGAGTLATTYQAA